MVCICRDSLFVGVKSSRELTYLLFANTKRDKELQEMLLKDKEHDLYCYLIDGQFNKLYSNLIDRLVFCEEHINQSIFINNKETN